MKINIESIDKDIPVIHLSTGNVKLSTANLNQVLPLLTNTKPPVETGIFMPAVRWVSNDLHSVIMERPPSLIDVHFQTIHHGKKLIENVPTPWKVLGIRFGPGLESVHCVYMFIRKHPIAMLDDALYLPFYPNVYSDSKLCMGDAFYNTHYPEFVKNAKANNILTLANATSFIYNSFWNEVWNNEVLQWMDTWRVAKNVLPVSLRNGPYIADTSDPSSDAKSLAENKNDQLAIDILNRYTKYDLGNFLEIVGMTASTSLCLTDNPSAIVGDTVGDLINTLIQDKDDQQDPVSFSQLASAISKAHSANS